MLASAFSGLALGASSVAGVRVNAPRRAAPTAAPLRLNIEAAHKKGAGSTNNGRDSESKRLGIKVYGGQPVKAGGIIVRQRGSEWHPARNSGSVAMGNDFTIFAKEAGIVVYEQNKYKREINVYPVGSEKALAAMPKNEPKPDSRRNRKYAKYTSRKAVAQE